MSLASFQSTMLRLIVDPDFRDRVVARAGSLPPGLTAREQARLRRIAADRGLDINRTLHKGFRLGKLRALLPLACQLLGPIRLAREVSAFWQARPPSSFYFLPEALDFCDFLASRGLRGKYLSEVVAYERATLELERARVGAVPVQVVCFEHDPSALLATLSSGKRPRKIPRRACRATGMKDAQGRVTWHMQATPQGGLPIRDTCQPDARALGPAQAGAHKHPEP